MFDYTLMGVYNIKYKLNNKVISHGTMQDSNSGHASIP
jgi:hypothetical protein